MEHSQLEDAGLLPLLETHAIFGRLPREALPELAARFTWVHYRAGEILCEYGEPGDCMYLVVYGRLRVLNKDRTRVLGEIGHGECVGEMSLITGETRSATLLTVRDSELVRLDKQDFDELVTQFPSTMMGLTRLIVQRLRRDLLEERPALRVATIAVVALDPDLPVTEFCARLCLSLQRLGPACHLTAEVVEGEVGFGDDDTRISPRTSAWLNQREHQYDYVLYQAGARDSRWTRCCLRQADCILFLCPSRPPRQGDLLISAFEGLASSVPRVRKELVFLYQGGEQPKGTAETLRYHRNYNAYHHLHVERPRHYGRLARLLAGRALGLVLGGGGARGFAHIGVLRALDELEIPIDAVGGTSMGAIIGAQYAMGWDVDHILQRTREEFVEKGSIFDFTLPMLALTRGSRFRRMGRNLYGETEVEDLWIPYYCVSTNLTRAESFVHRSGLLWRAVRCSTAIPGLVPPVFHQRNTLVDGGLLNNVPVDVMLEQGRGPVFAVDVSPNNELSVEFPVDQDFSPWGMLRNRINPFAPKLRVPSILNILLRTAMISSSVEKEALQKKTEAYLTPPIERFHLLDWQAIEKIEQIGYEYALKTLRPFQEQFAGRRRR
ncbi:patatin-like phospholipase family protein [Acanthopleuribacter pedis]|uniref:Patatin-like phospholipase family protein n=1 Tax=Acanthopleuribacter pedis TaxID=442870 RepID=A0A8J7QB02_9BACT|nr:patatin-like phospholipase family protein [Acanthopleuribacter pedis]MBO1317531.1 patatin-like phospholipase family protein [Acanthopleuribacter pedis]